MDLKQLEYFVRVAEVGSFTRAANALNIAQPALSRQIRLLEVELHQNLLTRNGRGASPTEAGKLLLEHGRGILHQISRAKEELGRVRGALAGRVAIGMPPSVSKIVAVPLIREFRKTMPDATLSIMEGLSVAMHEALLTGRLDIALLYNATPAPGIELTPLVDEPLFLIERAEGKAPARPKPVTLRDLADFPLVIPSRPHAIRMQVEMELAAVGRRPDVVLEIDGVATILDLVRDGAGCAILSRNAVSTSTHPKAFTCRPITGPAMRSKLMSAMSSQRPATLTQKAILQLIQDMAPRLLVAA